MMISTLIFLLSQPSLQLDREENLKTLFDFSNKEKSGTWRSVNDTVMGGRSRGTYRVDSKLKRLEFSGFLSLKNNGGFSSIRTRGTSHDLSAYSGIQLRVRGDGRRYSLNLRTGNSIFNGSYRTYFQTKKNQWETVFVPFSSFKLTWRGRLIKNAPKLNLKKISSVGITLSDKREGQFKLEIDAIMASKTAPKKKAKKVKLMYF